MPSPRNLTFEPHAAVRDHLEMGRAFFEQTLKDRGFLAGSSADDKKIGEILIGEQSRVGHSVLSAIRVVPVSMTPTWLASRVRTDQHNMYIDCMTRTAERETVDELIVTFAGAVQQWMMEFEQLQLVIPELNIRAYDSWIDSIQYGYSQGQAWRIARLDYWMKVQHVYSDIKFTRDCQ